MAFGGLTILPDMLLFRITYMENKMKKLIIMTAILIGLSVPAVAEIEIKGFKLEMTKKEAKQTLKAVKIKSKWLNAKLIPHHYMTLAGVNTPTPTIWYDKKNKADGKPVVEIAWIFCYDAEEFGCAMQGSTINPTAFAVITDALKSKYAMTCDEHEVQNGFGAKFTDRTCIYENNGVILKTERYTDSLKESRISIYKKGTSKINKDDI